MRVLQILKSVFLLIYRTIKDFILFYVSYINSSLIL